MTSKGKRIAWVTGGGSGIGLAGAEALAADGWTVAISGRRLDVLADAAKRIGDSGAGPVDVFPVDVARADDVHAVARSILAKHGQIDLLVNNAGLNVPKRSWKELEIGGWDQIVEVNLSGVLYAIHAVLPAMRDRKSGSIINTASWAGRIVSQMTGPAYTATKHAVSHAFVQYGRVPQRPQGMLSHARRGRNSHHEAASGTALGRSDVDDAAARGLGPDDCVCGRGSQRSSTLARYSYFAHSSVSR